MTRLREFVERGKSEAEIMSELDIRESATLQQALQEVMRKTA